MTSFLMEFPRKRREDEDKGRWAAEDAHAAWRQSQQREFYAAWQRRQHAAAALGLPDVRQSTTKPAPSAPSPKQDHASRQAKLTQDAERISTHEAGHAILAFALGRKISRITIEARGRGAGELDVERAFDCKDMEMLAGGRAAEVTLLGECMESGCTSDDAQIAERAKALSIRDGVREEVLIKLAHEKALTLLTAYRSVLDDLSRKLRAVRTMEGEAVEAEILRLVDAVHEREDAEAAGRKAGGRA